MGVQRNTIPATSRQSRPACDSPKQWAAALDHFHSQARRTNPARTGLFSMYRKNFRKPRSSRCRAKRPERGVQLTGPARKYRDKIAAGKSNGPTNNSGASEIDSSVDASNIQCP